MEVQSTCETIITSSSSSPLRRSDERSSERKTKGQRVDQMGPGRRAWIPTKWETYEDRPGLGTGDCGNLVHTTYTLRLRFRLRIQLPLPLQLSLSLREAAVASFCISVFLRHIFFLFFFFFFLPKTTTDAGGGYGEGCSTLMQILWRKKKKKL